MTRAELIEEIRKLHELILKLASRLADASDVLGMLAERKDRRKVEMK